MVIHDDASDLLYSAIVPNTEGTFLDQEYHEVRYISDDKAFCADSRIIHSPELSTETEYVFVAYHWQVGYNVAVCILSDGIVYQGESYNFDYPTGIALRLYPTDVEVYLERDNMIFLYPEKQTIGGWTSFQCIEQLRKLIY